MYLHLGTGCSVWFQGAFLLQVLKYRIVQNTHTMWIMWISGNPENNSQKKLHTYVRVIHTELISRLIRLATV